MICILFHYLACKHRSTTTDFLFDFHLRKDGNLSSSWSLYLHKSECRCFVVKNLISICNAGLIIMHREKEKSLAELMAVDIVMKGFIVTRCLQILEL